MKLVSLFALVLASGCDGAVLNLVDRPPAEGEGEGEGEGDVVGEGEGEGGLDCSPVDHGGVAPVKILFVVDVSGSLQFTDQANERIAALNSAMQSLRERSDVLVAVMGFGSNLYTEPQVTGPADPLFYPVAQYTEPPFLTVKDVSTDTHAALDGAFHQMFLDALRTDPAELSRTKYVVVFVTDGAPDPRCCIAAVAGDIAASDPTGCPLEAWETNDPSARYCDGSVEAPLCDDEDTLISFRDGVQDVVGGSGQPDYGDGVLIPFQDLPVGGNYNRLVKLEDDARHLTELTAVGAGAIDVHFFRLRDLALPDDVKQAFALNECRLDATMTGLADAAGGTSSLLESGSMDLLAGVDTSPLCP